tara:strand:+ start:1723 stop:1998 length:276 start_codon:yes stop_codon:yes gene_type:complete
VRACVCARLAEPTACPHVHVGAHAGVVLEPRSSASGEAPLLPPPLVLIAARLPPCGGVATNACEMAERPAAHAWAMRAVKAPGSASGACEA